MNTNLSPFANVGMHIQELLNLYLLPASLIATIAAIILFLMAGRGRHAGQVALNHAVEVDFPPVIVDTRVALLVVDDSAVARAKLSKLFEADGYRVELAKDGLEAMEKLTGDFFSVLVTDLEMPNMNGLELIAAVQGGMATEDLPIIAITGHDELQARVHEYQGLYGIFKKPWNDRELLKRVEALAVLRKPDSAIVSKPQR
jgi:CheY-like chemotaxis protein